MTSYQLWERVFPQEKRWLSLIVFGSLLLHLMVFFIFRIEKLPEPRALERPTSVTFISGSNATSRLNGSDPMLWINWRDPAVIALPRAPMPELEPRQAKRGANYSTQPLPALPEWNPLKIKNLGVVEELKSLVKTNMEKTGTEAMPITVEAPPKLSGTVVVLQGKLKGRKVVKRIQMPRPQTRVSLRASEYYVQVLAGGAVVQVKIDRSCGDTAIDQLGLGALNKWLFEPIETGDVWGRVVVFWDFQEENPDRVELQF